MKTQLVFIYALCDPETSEVRYIGQSENPHRRFDQHCRDAGDSAKAQWISELESRGLSPQLRVIKSAPRSEASKHEREAVIKYASEHDLFNIQYVPVEPVTMQEVRSGRGRGLSDKTIDTLIQQLHDDGRRADLIRVGLKMLGISQSEIADAIGRAHISVRKALNRVGTGQHDVVLSEIEAVIEQRLNS